MAEDDKNNSNVEPKTEKITDSLSTPSSSTTLDSGVFGFSPNSNDSKVNQDEANSISAALKRPTQNEVQSCSNVKFKKVKKTNRKKLREKNRNRDSSDEQMNVSDSSSSNSSSDETSSDDSSTNSLTSTDSESKDKKPELSDDELWLKKDINSLEKNDWVACREFVKREYGIRSLRFVRKTCGSRQMVRKLRRMHCLKGIFYSTPTI